MIKVTTDRPLFHNEKQIGGYQQYSNLVTPGKPFMQGQPAPTGTIKPPAAPAKKKPGLGQKLSGAVQKAKNSGFLQNAANLFLAPKADTTAPPPVDTTGTPTAKPHSSKSTMSTGAKVGIAAAVVTVLVIVIVVIEKRKNGGAK